MPQGLKLAPETPENGHFRAPGAQNRPPGAPGGPPPAPGPPGPESLYRPLFNSGVCTYTPRLPHARRASFFGYFLGGPGFLCAFPREPAETPPEPRIRAPRGRPRGPPGPPGPPRPPGGPKNGPQDPNFGHFQPPRPLILAPAPPDSRVPGQFSVPAPPSAPEMHRARCLSDKNMSRWSKFCTLLLAKPSI